MSASTAQPGGTSRRTHSLPQALTSLANRSLNEPLTSDSARCRTPFRTAISMKPVAEVVPTSTGRAVRNSRASGASMPASSCSIAPERCPIIGRCMAARTSGWTSVGPGRKNRPNTGGGGTGAVMRWREHVEHGRHVLVGEHVEAMLVEQDIPLVRPYPIGQGLRIGPRRLDDERIPECRLGNLLLAGGASHTVCREGALPIGTVGDLGMPHDVIVRARHDADAVAVRVVRQALQVRDDPLRLGHVQLAVGVHEVVLGVDIPEDDASHGGESLRGYRSVSTAGRTDEIFARPRA